MKRKILMPKFFNRRTPAVAEDLIGKYLVRECRGEEMASMITETEAYDGERDRACHACRGKTPRNAVMFGEAGVWYVYFTYGMHFMLNIVTEERGYPAAVLIRAAESVSGPGRLTKSFSIDKEAFNEKRAERKTGLWIEDRSIAIPKKQIQRTPRIGISSVPSPWREKPYRFVYHTE